MSAGLPGILSSKIDGFVVLPVSGGLIYGAYRVSNGSPHALQCAICSHAGTILYIRLSHYEANGGA